MSETSEKATIELLRPAGLVHSPAFSHVAVVPPGATTVFVGGQNGVDADGQLVGGDDIVAQTRQTMQNLHTALAGAGVGYDEVISVSLFLLAGTDIRAAYQAASPFMTRAGEPPLVTAAVVSALGVPGALLEVSAVAATVR